MTHSSHRIENLWDPEEYGLPKDNDLVKALKGHFDPKPLVIAEQFLCPSEFSPPSL